MMDKGPINGSHVLLLPIEHYASSLACSPTAWAEMQRYLSALKACAASQVCMLLCCAALRCAALCCAVLCCAVLCCAVLGLGGLCCAAFGWAAQHCAGGVLALAVLDWVGLGCVQLCWAALCWTEPSSSQHMVKMLRHVCSKHGWPSIFHSAIWT